MKRKDKELDKADWELITNTFIDKCVTPLKERGYDDGFIAFVITSVNLHVLRGTLCSHKFEDLLEHYRESVELDYNVENENCH